MQTRTLADPPVLAARREQLSEAHIAPLTAFAGRLRQSSGLWAPDFDPASGGVSAFILLLLESPGPKVSSTGFVSLDNPDATAENMSCLLRLAGLNRKKVLLWNSVPWQLSGDGVVAPTERQLREAAPATRELLSLLPKLRAVVLLGDRAKRGWPFVADGSSPAFQVLSCPHPSAVNFGPRPEAAVSALGALVRARRLCE